MRIVCDMFNGGNIEEMLEFNVFLTASNIFCSANVPIDPRNLRRGEEIIHYPMELGIVSYTLRHGISDPISQSPEKFGQAEDTTNFNGTGVPGRFHRFIDPGRIAKGFSSEGMEHSAKTHKLPMYPCVSGSVGMFPPRAQAFKDLLQEIEKFCAESIWDIEHRKKLVLYTFPHMVTQMLGVFKFFADASEDPEMKDLVENRLFIGDVTDLLLEMMRVAGTTLPKSIGLDRMTSAVNNFTFGKE